MTTTRCYHSGHLNFTDRNYVVCDNCGHVENACHDTTGTLLMVGDTVLAPFAKGGAGGAAQIVKGTIVAISEQEHLGCGYYQCRLTIQPVNGGKKMSHKYPANCVKVQP